MKKIFALFCFMLLTPTVFATIYNVKQDGTGNFTTIQTCANAAVAGDTCLVHPGIYRESVTISRSGTEGAPITFKGEEGAVIDGEGDTLGINARQYGFYLTYQSGQGKSYITIDNFEIRNLRYIYEDNFWYQPFGVFVYGNGTDVIIKNLDIHDVKKKSMAVDTEQGTISLTSISFTDTGQDFTQYAGMPGQLATHKILISWLINGQKSDYYQTMGFIGELNGNNTSVKIYKDLYLTQPGWQSLSFDPLSSNNSGYFYWVYNLSNGSRIWSGGIGIYVSGHSNVFIHDNRIQEARGGISVAASGGRISDNIQIYNNDISLTSWGINPTAGGYAGEYLDNLQIFNNTLHDFKDYVEYDWGWHNDGYFYLTLVLEALMLQSGM